MKHSRSPRDETFLTVAEIAELLKVHEQTVRDWLNDGDLEGIAFGGRTGWRVTERALQEFLDRRREASRSEE